MSELNVDLSASSAVYYAMELFIVTIVCDILNKKLVLYKSDRKNTYTFDEKKVNVEHLEPTPSVYLVCVVIAVEDEMQTLLYNCWITWQTRMTCTRTYTCYKNVSKSDQITDVPHIGRIMYAIYRKQKLKLFSRGVGIWMFVLEGLYFIFYGLLPERCQ